jgi:hypothetical protein
MPRLLFDDDAYGLTVAEYHRVYEMMSNHAFQAYATREQLRQRAATPGSPLDQPTPGEQMHAWIRAYVERTEPTPNECLITETTVSEGGSTTYVQTGLLSFSAVTSDQLVESSAYTTPQRGWYAVVPVMCVGSPYLAAPSVVVPHVIVHRVFPERSEDTHVSFRRFYQHPSPEYAYDVARRILTGHVTVHTWRNFGIPLKYERWPSHVWRLMTNHDVSHVEVCEITGTSHERWPVIERVDVSTLIDRGQWPKREDTT